MTRQKYLFAILLLSLLANSTWLYKHMTSKARVSIQKEFPLLSKRIFVEDQNDILINFIPLRTVLNQYVQETPDTIGIYFEYLPSGTSIGVNDKTEVKIVSLVKVPLAMSIFKKIERGKLSLEDTLVIEERHLNQRFGTLWQRGAGAKVSVGELVRLTLTESDNTAYNVLYDQLTEKEIGEVYESLDIPLNMEVEGGNVYILVSPKNYSSIFRSLYLSSFLSIENSNTILEILTKTIFTDKISAGVPTDIPVAHKIGVYSESRTANDVYTDCGIVYVPKRPYTICIFVKSTEENAKKHMSRISQMIYKYIRIVKVE